MKVMLSKQVIIPFCLMMVSCSGGVEDKWSASRPKPVKAGGVVTYQGAPLAGATIILASSNPKQRPATSMTDSSGSFQLMTYQPGDGAVPGEYGVIIKKLDDGGAPITDGPSDSEPAGKPAPLTAKHALPEKYLDPTVSKLSATIKSGESNRLQFDLKD